MGPVLEEVEVTYELSRPEVTVLLNVANNNGITASNISELTKAPKNTISRGIRRLVTKQIVTKREDALDKRKQRLYITSKGRRLYKKIHPHFIRYDKQMLSSLTAQETRQLLKLITKLANSSNQ